MNNEVKRSLSARWCRFTLERFQPAAHLLMISAFFCACGLTGVGLARVRFEWTWNLIPAFIATICMFFHMRIFDEIKDYDHDIEVNPERPLARGLISVPEAKRMAFVLIIAELILSGFVSLQTLVGACLVIVYTLIMYKEFFIGDWLRPKLATYALFHTVVAGWIALFAFTAFTHCFFWEASFEYWLFVVASYFIFNIFEFGRKTFAPEEEREGVESYSRNFGLWRATANVSLVQAIPSAGIAWYIGVRLGWHSAFYAVMGLLTVCITVSSIVFALKPGIRAARIFRGICSAFIVLFNCVMAVAAGYSL